MREKLLANRTAITSTLSSKYVVNTTANTRAYKNT